MMIRCTLLIAFLVLLMSSIGCVTYGECFSVISEPPGAHIEVNEEYIGEAPLEYCMKDYWIDEQVVIRATPSEAGHYVQTKKIRPYQPMPKKLYFNMMVRPAPLDLRIESR